MQSILAHVAIWNADVFFIWYTNSLTCLVLQLHVIDLRCYDMLRQHSTVADLGGVRGVQMHPPLAASRMR